MARALHPAQWSLLPPNSIQKLLPSRNAQPRHGGAEELGSGTTVVTASLSGVLLFTIVVDAVRGPPRSDNAASSTVPTGRGSPVIVDGVMEPVNKVRPPPVAFVGTPVRENVATYTSKLVAGTVPAACSLADL